MVSELVDQDIVSSPMETKRSITRGKIVTDNYSYQSAYSVIGLPC